MTRTILRDDSTFAKLAPFAWRTVTREETPAAPGAYAVFVDGKLQYVGSTENLRKRAWIQLRRERGFWMHSGERYEGGDYARFPGARHVEVRIKPARRFGDWLMHEARIMYRLRPPLNAFIVGDTKRQREPRRYGYD